MGIIGSLKGAVESFGRSVGNALRTTEGKIATTGAALFALSMGLREWFKHKAAEVAANLANTPITIGMAEKAHSASLSQIKLVIYRNATAVVDILSNGTNKISGKIWLIVDPHFWAELNQKLLTNVTAIKQNIIGGVSLNTTEAEKAFTQQLYEEGRKVAAAKAAEYTHMAYNAGLAALLAAAGLGGLATYEAYKRGGKKLATLVGGLWGGLEAGLAHCMEVIDLSSLPSALAKYLPNLSGLPEDQKLLLLLSLLGVTVGGAAAKKYGGRLIYGVKDKPSEKEIEKMLQSYQALSLIHISEPTRPY